MLAKFLKRDVWWLGITIGIVLPAVFYLVLFGVDILVSKIFDSHMLAKQEYLYLVSIAINLFAIKYYFVNLKYDKTGRGILLVTFVLAMIYFLIN